MKRRIHFMALTALLPLIVFAAGCSRGYFKDIRPKNKSDEVSLIPAFSWEVKKQVQDLQFELYRAADYRVETNEAAGAPLLRVRGLVCLGKQDLPLKDAEALRSKFRAEGVFLTPGHDTLKGSQDYVWVLRGEGEDGPFAQVYRFRTRREYYKPD